MTATRRLIVNADDFGLSWGVNEGVVEAHIRGIVTSASLMVRQPAAADAATRSLEYPELSVGLHIDLGEWTFESGSWTPRYEVADLNDPAALATEARCQLESFRRLVGRDPTHLDSHQHVHRSEPVRSVLIALANQLSRPLRHFADDIQYCGRFYGQTDEGKPLSDAISADGLIAVLDTLPMGLSELACHPAVKVEGATTYAKERVQELEALCDPRVRQVLAARGIELRSFRDLAQRDGRTRQRLVGHVS
jgi:predicted glycoside hydrolase/deacetylase ChbG (UPF0249 family)